MPRHTKIPWEIKPHTIAKHKILKKYLDAWLPILSTSFGKVVYIDGFAGPGEYIYKDRKVDGSPIIAIKSFLNHKFKEKMNKIIFIFVEKDPKTFQYLNKKVKSYENKELEIIIKNNEFENIVSEIFNYLEERGMKIAPTLCFIDPFGIKGIPMSSIKRIMSNKRCEVLITFMYEELNRFLETASFENHVTKLFGKTREWKNIVKIKNPKQRYFRLTKLYETQLRKKCDISYIRTFDMINKYNKKDYVLFFCSNSKKGLQKMKEAMWRVDKSGKFQFSDATYEPSQKVLFEDKPNYDKLKKIILNKYKGKEVKIEKLLDFVLIKTPFLPTGHVKKPVLKPMEKEGKIEVSGSRKKRFAYPPGTIVKFL